MNRNNSTSQKIGWAIFILGAIYMLGLGWLYSWWVVPAANQLGSAAISNWFGFIWALSVPLGAFIVVIGAALGARVERRVFWMLVLLVLLFTVWRIGGTSSRMLPALFGIGGGLITLFFVGSTWQWAKNRPSLNGAGKRGSDLRMVGFVFFVVAAWDLCGIFGMGNYVLRPDLAEKFSIPISSTINAASGVLVLLVLGWGFTYLGQLVSHRSQVMNPAVEKVRHTVVID